MTMMQLAMCAVATSAADSFFLAMETLLPRRAAEGRFLGRVLHGNHRSFQARCVEEVGPGFHELPAFVEQIPAAVGGLGRIRYRVRRGHFTNFVRKRGPFGSPISEGRAKAVNRDIRTDSFKQF